VGGIFFFGLTDCCRTNWQACLLCYGNETKFETAWIQSQRGNFVSLL